MILRLAFWGLILSYALLLISFKLWAGGGDWIIYGEDEREEIADTQAHALAQASSAVGLRVLAIDLVSGPLDGVLISRAPSAQKKYNLCPEVRFSDQSALGSCSGFLIGAQTLATAGHCMRSHTTCLDYQWAFHYRQDVQVHNRPIVLSSNLYSCQKIIFQKNPGPSSELDLAIIELDRPVEGARPLTLSRSLALAKLRSDELGMVGHPLGLPQKTVEKSSRHPRPGQTDVSFSLNLDAFGNNSGSPLINLHSGEVEGMLVGGESDWEMDLTRNCKVEKHCDEDQCRGETVISSRAVLRALKELQRSHVWAQQK